MVHGVWGHRTVCALILHGKALGQDIVNVHHFEAQVAAELLMVSDGIAQTKANDLRDDWIAQVKTEWLACHPAVYDLVNVGVQVLERPGLYEHRLSEQMGVVGATHLGNADTVAFGSIPDALQVAAEIKWRSLVSSRRARGRTYAGPILEAMTDAATTLLTTAAQTVFNAYATEMLNRYEETSGVSAAGWDFTIYNRPYDNGDYGYVKRVAGVRQFFYPPDYAGDVNHILTGVVDSTPRTQRRREIGVGS